MLFRAEVWRCAACAQRRARISRAIGGKRLRPLQVPRRATSPPAALAASQFPQTIRGELARRLRRPARFIARVFTRRLYRARKSWKFGLVPTRDSQFRGLTCRVLQRRLRNQSRRR